jgi:1,4-dihydroxy-2-naphthoate polyprenyltransferase
VESGRVTALAVLMACAMGFLATAILVLNNLRDIDTDAAAGKRTLATRIGRPTTRWLLVGLLAAAFAIPVVVSFSMPTVLITLLAAPIAWSAANTAFASAHAPSLVNALKRMAIAELVYALLFALATLL